MKRKIIQIAGSTYLVSLPKKWCVDNNLKKGEEIDVEAQGGEVIVTAQKKIIPSSTEMDITGLDRTSIFFAVRALYKKGYDEIKLTFKNPVTKHFRKKIDLNVSSIIQIECSRLPGMEIIEQKNNNCILKAISDVNLLDEKILIKRIFGLIDEAYNELIEGGELNDNSLLTTVKQKHDTITKFISHSQRVLNKNKLIDKDNYYLSQILTQMDNITDLLDVSARNLRDYNKKIDKITIDILKLMQQNFETYLKLYSRFDKEYLREMNKNKVLINEKILKFGKKIPFEEASVLLIMQNSLKILRSLTESNVSKHF